jgi:hypothetical protein
VPFVSKKSKSFAYLTPQEMYKDNKRKKIMGTLDYQSSMLEEYRQNIDKKTVALEMPTGSGKTLVGLLVGEFRRRKNNETVLFLCPTNQLVHQVVEQANSKYGIDAIAFTGRQRDYSAKDRQKYVSASAIGVTTYSSFFSNGQLFKDPEVLILDDVHAAENYIVSNWSIRLDRSQVQYSQLCELFKEIMPEWFYQQLSQSEDDMEPYSSCDMLPFPLLEQVMDRYSGILASLQSDTSNYYAYNRIRENLDECNIFLNRNEILIRPWIAPTETFAPFVNSKQRVLMSATLGRGGELERVTGIEDITRLPIAPEWEKTGIGRRFFLYPELANNISIGEAFSSLQSIFRRSVVLVPNNGMATKLIKTFNESMPEVKVFQSQNIETSKNEFINSSDATVILANRYDGIDFPEEESRLLFIFALPKVTNLQERFLIERSSSNILYGERLRTRVIQSVGRCTRRPGDYSLICVFDGRNVSDLSNPKVFPQYPPELRAEMQYGIENSQVINNLQDLIEQSTYFRDQTNEWQSAEDTIISYRDDYSLVNSSSNNQDLDTLQKCARIEVRFQYALWAKDYKRGYEEGQQIISTLSNSSSLKGYYSFWNIIQGCVAYKAISMDGNYFVSGSKCLEQAKLNNNSIRWIPFLAKQLFSNIIEDPEARTDYFEEALPRFERVLTNYRSLGQLQNDIQRILANLQSQDGTEFEQGHRDLGKLLGYISVNPSEHGAPDPYWVLSPGVVLVSEDKIYSEGKGSVKSVPLRHVREALTHEKWIRQNVHQIIEPEIYTVFITTSSTINADAHDPAEGLFYLKRSDLYQWAIKATTTVQRVYSSFTESGNAEWQNSTHTEFLKAQVLPSDALRLFTGRHLTDLTVTKES